MMMNKALRDTYVAGGVTEKAMSLDQLDAQIRQQSAEKTEAHAYGAVPYVWRAMRLRCNALAGLPWSLYNDAGEEVDHPWDLDFSWLLWRTEAALCLAGASYWRKYKVKPFLQWLNPFTMTVEPAPNVRVAPDGVAGFTQRVKAEEVKFRRDQVVYVPLFDPRDDIGAGVAPVQVALNAAGVAENVTTWASQFFEKGAIPYFVLTTEGRINDADQKRVRDFWDRLFGGVRRMWKTAVLQNGLKPTTIGHPVKELAMTELDDQVLRKIAAALEVPLTMVNQSAANYATAKADRQSFYYETVFPEARRIESATNAQLWSDMGLRFEFKYGDVEAVQQDEAEKAGGITQLMDQALAQHTSGILARNQAQYIVTSLWGQMGLDLEDVPAIPDDEEEEESGETELAENLEQEEPDDETPDTEEMIGELRKWRRKVRNRGAGCEFASEAIPGWVKTAVAQRLALDADTAFDPWLKADALQVSLEDRLREVLNTIYASHLPRIIRAVLQQERPDMEPVYLATRSAIIPLYQEAIINATLEQASAMGYGVDYDDLMTDAAQWASNNAARLVRQISETDRKHLQKIITQLANGEIDNDAAQALLATVFGKTRADMITTTEITQALHEASVQLQDRLAVQGVKTVIRWLTAEDERVCPICEPLDHTTEAVWAAEFPDGPPAHVRCRCRTVVEVAREHDR